MTLWRGTAEHSAKSLQQDWEGCYAAPPSLKANCSGRHQACKRAVDIPKKTACTAGLQVSKHDWQAECNAFRASFRKSADACFCTPCLRRVQAGGHSTGSEAQLNESK